MNNHSASGQAADLFRIPNLQSQYSPHKEKAAVADSLL